MEILTKYERARILGARALQISMGAPFLVKLEEKDLEAMKFNPLEIAKMELAADAIPIAVRRKVIDTRFVEEEKKEAS